MADNYTENRVNLDKRREILAAIPCFAGLSKDQCEEFIELMREMTVSVNETIVVENKVVDSIYFIVSGNAEVSQEIKKFKKIKIVPVASLNPGDTIGLNEAGFYSQSGVRTATVTALTDMLLLKLDLKDLYGFLEKHQLNKTMQIASLQMLRMYFIKQSLPFSNLSLQRLQNLAEKVIEREFAANTIIFKQGDKGDTCYLITSGSVEIFTQDANDKENSVAILKPPSLFGEATLITEEPRNATARTREPTKVLCLKREYLIELLESEKNVAQVFMNLMIDRSRPLQNPHVTVHERQTEDGTSIVILKNPQVGTYFKLSDEGFYIWTLLDGERTLQEITLNLAEKYGVFAPDMVAALISKLARANFICNIELEDTVNTKKSWFANLTLKIRRLSEFRYAIGDVDGWITRIYQRYIHYFVSKPAQFVLAFFAMLGFFAFVFNTGDVLLFFSDKHASLWLLLGILPFSLCSVILHELGHAFAVKAFGREVHFMGIGWFWVTPVAFTDTSDMWLAARKPRMWVNLAGIYVDILFAGAVALCMFLTNSLYLQCLFWLFALYTYIGAIRHLSPLQEMDGYYALMDWVDRNRLRQSAIKWLLKGFPQALKQPSLFKQHKPEVTYWLACIFYLILLTLLTLVVQAFVFIIFGIESPNRYLVLALPLLVAIVSSLPIIDELRRSED